jgi:hypothetical protein
VAEEALTLHGPDVIISELGPRTGSDLSEATIRRRQQVYTKGCLLRCASGLRLWLCAERRSVLPAPFVACAERRSVLPRIRGCIRGFVRRDAPFVPRIVVPFVTLGGRTRVRDVRGRAGLRVVGRLHYQRHPADRIDDLRLAF